MTGAGSRCRNKPDGAGVFLKDNLCVIQPVKSQQCRDFPNLWKYPGSEKYCRAIPREVSEDDYVWLVSEATLRTPEAVREIIHR